MWQSNNSWRSRAEAKFRSGRKATQCKKSIAVNSRAWQSIVDQQSMAKNGACGKSNSHSGPKTNLARASTFSNPYVCLLYKLNTFHTMQHYIAGRSMNLVWWHIHTASLLLLISEPTKHKMRRAEDYRSLSGHCSIGRIFSMAVFRGERIKETGQKYCKGGKASLLDHSCLGHCSIGCNFSMIVYYSLFTKKMLRRITKKNEARLLESFIYLGG